MNNNKEIFKIGFIKAAVDTNIHPLIAIEMLKKIGADPPPASAVVNQPTSPVVKPLTDQIKERYEQFNLDMIHGASAHGGLEGLIGAGVGGVGGYISGQDDDPRKDHRKRNAFLGALGGGLALGTHGAYRGANDIYREQLADPMIDFLKGGLNNNITGFAAIDKNIAQNNDAINGQIDGWTRANAFKHFLREMANR